MYGLPRAGRLVNDQLIAFLAPYCYHPIHLTPGLWRHAMRDIAFSLVVNKFGVQYTDRADADHLISASPRNRLPRQHGLDQHLVLRINSDMGLSRMQLRRVDAPTHCSRLASFSAYHPIPTRSFPTSMAKTKKQLAILPNNTGDINAADKHRILKVLGTLLFYARAIDTLHSSISKLATEQSEGTKTTMNKLTQFLNFCATNPDASARFTTRDMILAVESEALYLSVIKARSRAAGYFYVTNAPTLPTDALESKGEVRVLCHIMREVLSSAAEAESGALFHNGKEACPLRIALDKKGHPQPPTPMATDNNTASGIAAVTGKQKWSKAINMRFYWIRNRVRQGQFHIYWSKGQTNCANHFSIYHLSSHHQAIPPAYLYTPTSPTRNYFDCLADTTPPPCTTVPRRANALMLPSVTPGEGVLFYPGNPEGHCKCVTRCVTMTDTMATQSELIIYVAQRFERQSLQHDCHNIFDVKMDLTSKACLVACWRDTKLIRQKS